MITRLSYFLVAIIIAGVSPAFAGDILVSAQVDSVSTSGTVSTVNARIGITNDSAGAINNIVGSVTAIGDGVTVTDDTVSLGSVGGGASAVSTDTFTVTMDSAVTPSGNVGLPVSITYQDSDGIPQKKTAVVLITLE
ncbi:MAG: hypothetical protein HZA20_01175 [Nitrospirae bacterium]|nr:hypothetical protein [Nitrospirota bacterium]